MDLAKERPSDNSPTKMQTRLQDAPSQSGKDCEVGSGDAFAGSKPTDDEEVAEAVEVQEEASPPRAETKPPRPASGEDGGGGRGAAFAGNRPAEGEEVAEAFGVLEEATQP
jgi:hypothetical protein